MGTQNLVKDENFPTLWKKLDFRIEEANRPMLTSPGYILFKLSKINLLLCEDRRR